MGWDGMGWDKMDKLHFRYISEFTNATRCREQERMIEGSKKERKREREKDSERSTH